MSSAQALQLGAVKALRSDGNAIDATGAKSRQVAALGGPGVDLDGDLSPTGNSERPIRRIQQPPNLRRVHE